MTSNADNYVARERRIHDAIDLRQPDALPAILFLHFGVARRAGMTCRESMYDFAMECVY